MRRKIRKIRKIVFVSVIIIILIIIGIFIGKKGFEVYKNYKNNQLMQEKINNLFIFEDLTLNYDMVKEKYNKRTDNINGDGNIFCSTFNTKFDYYNVVKVLYYNESMEVRKINIHNYENSKYEVFNYLSQYLGECSEYDSEIKELATQYKWKYNNYSITLIDNIDSNTIAIEKIN